MGGLIVILLGIASVVVSRVLSESEKFRRDQEFSTMLEILAEGGSTMDPELLIRDGLPRTAPRELMYRRMWTRYPLSVNGRQYQWSSTSLEGAFLMTEDSQVIYMKWEDIRQVGVQLPYS